MKLLSSLILVSLSFGLACSSRPKMNSASNGSGDSDVGKNDPEDGESTDINDDGSVNLELSPEIGSKLRFMNGQALTQVYSRVFKQEDSGFAHCEKTKPTEYTGCALLFNSEERPSMGMFDLYSERMHRGVQNVAQTESLTLNYTRNLRAALGRECKRLVEKEEASPEAGNLLVKDTAPTAAHLEAFVRKILDAPDKSVELDIPFADYVKAFQTASAMGDPQKAKTDAYINLCISLAMDPQIFMY